MSDVDLLILLPAIDVVLTVGGFLYLEHLFQQRRPFLAVAASSLFVPVLMIGFGAWVLLKPDPSHDDAPVMFGLASIGLALLTLPIGVAVSILTLLIQRHRMRRRH